MRETAAAARRRRRSGEDGVLCAATNGDGFEAAATRSGTTPCKIATRNAATPLEAPAAAESVLPCTQQEKEEQGEEQEEEDEELVDPGGEEENALGNGAGSSSSSSSRMKRRRSDDEKAGGVMTNGAENGGGGSTNSMRRSIDVDENRARVSASALPTTSSSSSSSSSSPTAVTASRLVTATSGASVAAEVAAWEEEDRLRTDALAMETRWRLWMAAVKLPMYCVAVLPVCVGAALGYGVTGVFFKERFVSLLAGSVLVLGWLNLSNDGYDAETGVDLEKPESVVNLTSNKEGVLALAWSLLAAGTALIAHGLMQASRGTTCAALLATAIGCGWAYQCPPLRLSYRGAGELLCFLAFGPLATTAFSLAFGGGDIPAKSCAAAGVLVGWSTTAILFCSHFHQRRGDEASGKRSPVVRFGKKGMQRILRWSVLGFYTAIVGFAASGCLSIEHLAAYPLTIVSAVRLLRYVDARIDDEDGELRATKFRAIEWHIWQAAALAFGFSFALV